MNKDYWDTILKAVQYHSLTGEMPEDYDGEEEKESEPDEDVAGSHQNGER